MNQPQTTDSLNNVSEYTVTEISGALKRTVEDVFGHVRVRGEVSGYRGPHSSGHAYFALKDDRARLEAVVWRGTFSKLKFKPEEGMEVIATGRLSTYPGSSKYQIIIDNIEPAGAGALMALLEERKRKLAAEGLFEEARKRALPFMPRVIGVVTSPTGAVIRDIVHRITDRFPVHVLVWPVRVQGDTSGAEVSAAVAGLNALDPAGPIAVPDVIIVARGGGSLEDLWGFNDEAVVRAIAASRIPVISAVGHETDWTLADLAADRRAPTPTGAAEIAVPVKADLEATLSRLAARLKGAVSRSGERKRHALRALERALPSADQLLALPRRHFDEAASRLERALVTSTSAKRARFSGIRLQPATLGRRIDEAGRHLARSGQRLDQAHRRGLRDRRAHVARLAPRIAPQLLTRRIEAGRRALPGFETRMDRCVDQSIKRDRARLENLSRVMASLDYHAVLRRGFALVRDEDNNPLVKAAAVKPAAQLLIEFADGTVQAVAKGGETRSKGGSDRPTKKNEGEQGSLL